MAKFKQRIEYTAEKGAEEVRKCLQELGEKRMDWIFAFGRLVDRAKLADKILENMNSLESCQKVVLQEINRINALKTTYDKLAELTEIKGKMNWINHDKLDEPKQGGFLHREGFKY